jgi:aryl-alcohol dehydrogenase-like predicted oxidoreductase
VPKCAFGLALAHPNARSGSRAREPKPLYRHAVEPGVAEVALGRTPMTRQTRNMRYLNFDGASPISKIGLGTWQFGSSEWGYGTEYAERESQAIVRRAIELGVTLFDTAEVYGLGRSERILGKAIEGHRDSLFIATKLLPIAPFPPIVQQRAVASASRLGVRRIDLYQVHQPNPVVKDTVIMRGMRTLRQIGLIGDVGVSNYSLSRWRAAEAALGSRVLSNQVRYSLVSAAPADDLVPYAEETGRLVIAYSPLAQGLLSGGYDKSTRPANRVRRFDALFAPDNLERARPLLRVLREVADAHDSTPAQIALAWVIRSPAVTAIPGASSVRQLESNVAAAEIELADDEWRALREASAQFRPVTGVAALPGQLRARGQARRNRAPRNEAPRNETQRNEALGNEALRDRADGS